MDQGKLTHITGVVLAGGRSKRLGRDKALLRVGGTRLIERVTHVLLRLFGDVAVVGGDGEALSFLDIPLWKDLQEGCDSLGGIFTALTKMKTPWAFVCACDMPFLSERVVRFLASKTRDDVDVVVPRVEGLFEPLHALYARSCLPFIEDQAREKNLRILNFYDRISVAEVAQEEILPLDPSLLSFFNINTEEDLLRAHSIASSGPQKTI